MLICFSKFIALGITVLFLLFILKVEKNKYRTIRCNQSYTYFIKKKQHFFKCIHIIQNTYRGPIEPSFPCNVPATRKKKKVQWHKQKIFIKKRKYRASKGNDFNFLFDCFSIKTSR